MAQLVVAHALRCRIQLHQKFLFTVNLTLTVKVQKEYERLRSHCALGAQHASAHPASPNPHRCTDPPPSPNTQGRGIAHRGTIVLDM